MEFESLINRVEGVRDKVSGKLVVSKLSKSRCQDRINVRYLSYIRSSVRSDGSLVRGSSEYGGLVDQIFLIRRLIVGRRSSGIIFTFQTEPVSAAGVRSVGVILQFVFLSWETIQVIGHTFKNVSVVNLVFLRVRITCLIEITRERRKFYPFLCVRVRVMRS